MDRSRFSEASPGRLVPTVEDAWAFVPDPLPPAALRADWETASKASEAENALGRLEGVARDLRNPYLLIGPLQKREAIVSSRIEGTFTTARQLVLYEADQDLASEGSSETREVHMDRDTALAILRARFEELRPLGVRSLALFGSVARNRANAESDVDVLIDFGGPATFDAFMEAKEKLEGWLGCRVDLVTRKALRPRLLQAIEAEAVLVA